MERIGNSNFYFEVKALPTFSEVFSKLRYNDANSFMIEHIRSLETFHMSNARKFNHIIWDVVTRVSNLSTLRPEHSLTLNTLLPWSS